MGLLLDFAYRSVFMFAKAEKAEEMLCDHLRDALEALKLNMTTSCIAMEIDQGSDANL